MKREAGGGGSSGESAAGGREGAGEGVCEGAGRFRRVLRTRTLGTGGGSGD